MSNRAKALHSSENPLHEALAVSPLVITLLIVAGIFILIAIAYINHMLESSKLEKARLKADLIDRTRRNRSVSDNLPGQLMTPALKLLLSRLGWLVGRSFGRDDLVRNVTQVYGPCTHPSESALDDCWSLIAANRGTRILHKLAGYWPERNVHRERWVGALQREGVPLRFINGVVDPVSGAPMVERYRQLVPEPDTVQLLGIGHYPHTEAPVQVLRHYLAFREQPLSFLQQKVAWS